MPYQRESEKQAAAQEQQAPQPMQPQPMQPQPAAPARDLRKKQVQRGKFDMNRPGDPAEGFRMAQEMQRPGSAAVMGPDQEASPEEQAEYERAMDALSLMLYQNDKSSAGIQKILNPQEKVGSVAKASLLAIQQLDMKFDFDEVVIPELAQETVDRIIDLYENIHGEEFSDQEVQGALGATWEGVMEMYGMDESDYAELTAGMTEDDFKGYAQQYKQFLGE